MKKSRRVIVVVMAAMTLLMVGTHSVAGAAPGRTCACVGCPMFSDGPPQDHKHHG